MGKKMIGRAAHAVITHMADPTERRSLRYEGRNGSNHVRGLGKVNDTVDAIRRLREMWSAVKQPGRRYGPPPLSGNDRSTPPARMTNPRRTAGYRRQTSSLTPRQNRQLWRMDALDYRDALRKVSRL